MATRQTAPAPKGPQFNWVGYGKILLAGGAIIALIALFPMLRCIGRFASNAQITSIDLGGDNEIAYGTDRTADVTRVSATSGFLGRFFGGFPVCYRRFPITSAEDWQQKGAAGLGGLGLLMIGIGFATQNQRRT